MKILFLSQYFYPESFSNNAIAQHLVEQGHQVDVVSCVPNYPEGRFFSGYSNWSRRTETWNKVNIHRAWTISRGSSGLRLLINYLTYPFAAIWTASRLKQPRHDISFTSMPSPLFQALAAIFMKKIFNIPAVYWVQDIWPDSAIITLGLKNRFVIGLLNRLCGWIYRRADIVLIQSQAFRSRIENFGVQSEKILFFPNTAPEKYRFVKKSEVCEEISSMLPSASFNLMFAGNIGESQDFDSLIEAAELLKHHHELRWVVIGSGRDLERVKARLASLDLEQQFLFLGRFPEDQMPEFFAFADAMLVSLKDTPIFDLTVPYKVQCYMACGKPIIASLNGEGRRIIESSGAGYCAPASRPQQLAAQIEKMLSLSNEQRAKMGQCSLQYFEENYGAQSVYGMLTDTFAEVIDNKKEERSK